LCSVPRVSPGANIVPSLREAGQSFTGDDCMGERGGAGWTERIHRATHGARGFLCRVPRVSPGAIVPSLREARQSFTGDDCMGERGGAGWTERIRRAAYGARGFFCAVFPGFHPGLTSQPPSGRQGVQVRHFRGFTRGYWRGLIPGGRAIRCHAYGVPLGDIGEASFREAECS
jgi:hypothetical protein